MVELDLLGTCSFLHGVSLEETQIVIHFDLLCCLHIRYLPSKCVYNKYLGPNSFIPILYSRSSYNTSHAWFEVASTNSQNY